MFVKVAEKNGRLSHRDGDGRVFHVDGDGDGGGDVARWQRRRVTDRPTDLVVRKLVARPGLNLKPLSPYLSQAPQSIVSRPTTR